jgi:hypothetical protein
LENFVIFIHIPKTAGYAIARCLRQTKALKRGYGFTHRTAKECLKTNDKTNVIMCVVRNPYDRLHSVFEFYSKMRSVIRSSTFEEFVYEKAYRPKKGPFRSCFEYISVNRQIMATDILRFENLSCDYDSFCRRHHIQNNLVVMNQNPRKDNATNARKLYTPQMRAVVERVFRYDFLYFNYSYESFVANWYQNHPPYFRWI